MNQQNLGEQAIAKAIEIVVDSQLDEVDNLDVNIKNNPLNLAQGKVESFTIDGEGMVIKQDLRAERMILHTNSIKIDPLKAALGKLKLEKSTNVQAKLVLQEDDIEQAFNSSYIQNKLKDVQIELAGGNLTVNAKNVKFKILHSDRLYLRADINIAESGETKPISFSLKPDFDPQANKILLEDVEYDDNNIYDSTLAQTILNSIQSILDLNNLEFKNARFKINRINLKQGKITLGGKALVQDFPTQ